MKLLVGTMLLVGSSLAFGDIPNPARQSVTLKEEDASSLFQLLGRASQARDGSRKFESANKSVVIVCKDVSECVVTVSNEE